MMLDNKSEEKLPLTALAKTIGQSRVISFCFYDAGDAVAIVRFVLIFLTITV